MLILCHELDHYVTIRVTLDNLQLGEAVHIGYWAAHSSALDCLYIYSSSIKDTIMISLPPSTVVDQEVAEQLLKATLN